MCSELFAIWVQAGANIILVGVTIVYVVLTWRLARQAEKQIETQRKESERVARVALKYELLDIVRSCPLGDERPRPLKITTHVWDTMKGDLGTLGLSVLADLAGMYGQIRKANAIYEQYLRRPELPPGRELIPGDEDCWAQQLSGVVETARNVWKLLNRE